MTACSRWPSKSALLALGLAVCASCGSGARDDLYEMRLARVREIASVLKLPVDWDAAKLEYKWDQRGGMLLTYRDDDGVIAFFYAGKRDLWFFDAEFLPPRNWIDGRGTSAPASLDQIKKHLKLPDPWQIVAFVANEGYSLTVWNRESKVEIGLSVGPAGELTRMYTNIEDRKEMPRL